MVDPVELLIAARTENVTGHPFSQVVAVREVHAAFEDVCD